MVIGTRQDEQVKESSITDDNGDLITEKIEIPNIEKEKKVKQNKRNKENREQNIKNSKNQSRFKGLSKRLEQKTKKDNAIHTAKELIKNNKDKKKKKKIIYEPQPTDYKKNINKNKNNIL